MASGNHEADPSRKSGENSEAAGEVGRGEAIYTRYESAEDYKKFKEVLAATLPGRIPVEVLHNELEDEEYGKLEAALNAAFAEPAAAPENNPVAQPAGGDESEAAAAAAAAAATEAARTTYAAEHGVVPIGSETVGDDDEKKKAAQKRNVGRGVVTFAAGAAAAVTALAALGVIGDAGQEAILPTGTGDKAPQTEAGQQDQQEAAEDGETLGEYEDSLAGTYADAEDPSQINHNKLSRDGLHEAPYNFGESAIVYDENGEVDLDATYANAMERETWVAHHSTIEFAGQYALLSDGVKVPEAVGLTGQQLSQRMMEDAAFKKQVVESFMALMEAPGATEISQITGTYANMYLIETAQEGKNITSDNTILKHCITEENGSYVLSLTYQDGKDGKTHTLLMRLGCGFQPVAKEKSPEWTGITDTTPPMPDPEPPVPVNPEPDNPDPDKPDPDKPDPDKPDLAPKTDQPGIIGEWGSDVDLTPTGEGVPDGQGVTFYEDDQGGGSFNKPDKVNEEAEKAEDQSGAGVLENAPSPADEAAANNQAAADEAAAQARENFENSVVATNPDTGEGMTMGQVEDAVNNGGMSQDAANEAIADGLGDQLEGLDDDNDGVINPEDLPDDW